MNAQTAIAALRDPDTGKTRDVVVTFDKDVLLVTLSRSRPAGEDAPHHACADFSKDVRVIAKALLGD